MMFRRLLAPRVAVLALVAVALTAALAGCGGAKQERSPQPGSNEIAIVVQAPESTPLTDPVYLAGDFQGWTAGDPKWRLLPLGGNRHAIVFPDPGRRIEFKFTRGTWEKVEKGSLGEEIANRELAPTAGQSYRFAVANWADLGPKGPERESTVTGELEILEIPEFLRGRKVRVWLPPGYREGNGRYAVLYMWDGQNLFDEATSFAGEWRVDETCTSLIEAGRIQPFLVVGIDHAGPARREEYTPWSGPRGPGEGDVLLKKVVEVLKPRIDTDYRTLPDRQNTGIAGSSLGGLMTVYAMYSRREIFSRAGAFSPVLDWRGERVVPWVAERRKPDTRFYADMGGLESGHFVDGDGNGTADSIDGIRELREALIVQGFQEGTDLLVVEDPEAQHNEAAWAARLPAALEFLFPPADGP